MRAITPAVYFLLLAAGILVQNVAYGNPEYDRAFKLKNAGKHSEAIVYFKWAAEAAQSEGNALTEFSAYYGASFSAHRLSRNSDCLEYAEKALSLAAANRSTWWGKRDIQVVFELELLGLIERSFSNLARLGDGWQANRRTVEYLRQYTNLRGSGSITPDEVLALPIRLRHQGWRLIEREAEYLHETGKTPVARELLEAAIQAAKPDLEANQKKRSYYPLKLVGALALIEGFVGNEPRAIELHSQEYAYAEKWSNRSNLMRIQFNLLSQIADYRGADDEIVEEVNALLAEAEERDEKTLGAMRRMHTRIIGERLAPEERLKALVESASESESSELLIDSFYASRNELFVRAERNDPDLDADFMHFLQQSRSQGNFRAEPRIYRRYGDWLRLQKRYDEAIRMYHVSLEKVRLAEWHPTVLVLYAKLAATYLDSGESILAFEMIDRLESYLAKHESIPPHAVLRALRTWIPALLANGYIDRARSESDQWHDYGTAHAVPEKYLQITSTDYIDAFLERHGNGDSAPNASTSLAFLHPGSVNTVALPGHSFRVAFFIMNPGSATEAGILKVHGEGLERRTSDRDDTIFLRVAASGSEEVLSIPISLAGGTLKKVYLQRDAALGNSRGADKQLRLEWFKSRENEMTSSAIWNFSEGAATESAVVIEAAEIRPNPFVGVPVEHTVHFGDSADPAGLPFRIRSDQEICIEYRDPADGSVLAIDNNGNGDFSETGDLWVQADQLGTVAAPKVSRHRDSSMTSIEVWYFPDQDSDAEALNLSVEVYHTGEWIVQAIDRVALLP